MLRLGIDQICARPLKELTGKRLGLLANQASTDANFIHSRDRIIQSYPGQLVCIFSPQHGFFSEKQDNMIESSHGRDPVNGIPVYSLYGETRKPYPSMFTDIDVLLIDLIDVGTRVYTFIWTVIHCLQTAAETGTKIIILDRPNPIGGLEVEGNMLTEACTSFVGLCPIPMRHGMTMGELALYCNKQMEIGADLVVIPLKNWKRKTLFPETGLPWVFPSPNMPNFFTALVYPGQVLWEGSNISEGRGTTLPFEIFGAPFLEYQEILAALRNTTLPGCFLRPLCFEPTSGKWAQNLCKGFHLHVTNSDHFRPYRTSLALLQAVMRLYPEQYKHKAPPYEYEFERLPMDLLIGDTAIRMALENGVSPMELEQNWQEGLNTFRKNRETVLLYD